MGCEACRTHEQEDDRCAQETLRNLCHTVSSRRDLTDIPEGDSCFMCETGEMVEEGCTPCLILVGKEQEHIHRSLRIGHRFFLSVIPQLTIVLLLCRSIYASSQYKPKREERQEGQVSCLHSFLNIH